MPSRPKAAAAQSTASAPASTVANQVAGELARRIVDGRYAPGASLREVPLAAEFGVSRSSVREALRILERDGVARIAPHQGASVTRLTTDELIDIYQVRTALLGLAMALASERCSDADVDWVAARVEELRKAARLADTRAGTRHADVSAQAALHLIRLAGNRRLEQLLTQMAAQIARYTRLGLSTPERRRQSLATWEQVLEALRRRDAVMAERCGRKLVTDTLRFALGRIAGLDPGALG